MLIAAAWAIVSGYTSINAVVKAELFPAGVRATGVGLPYALTVSIFGGTAESVALWFKSIGHESWFYPYLTGCIAVSLVVYLFMRDTKRSGRIEARTGLRMMPTSPRSPLSFRTAGFPQYGWKAGLSGGAFPSPSQVKPAPGIR